MDISKHAKIRSQQRGIPASAIELILMYGEPKQAPGDAVMYEVSKDVIPQLQSRIKAMSHQIEKLKGTVILASEDGTVITTYRK